MCVCIYVAFYVNKYYLLYLMFMFIYAYITLSTYENEIRLDNFTDLLGPSKPYIVFFLLEHS